LRGVDDRASGSSNRAADRFCRLRCQALVAIVVQERIISHSFSL
jgi:hypothetical protein